MCLYIVKEALGPRRVVSLFVYITIMINCICCIYELYM